MFKNVQKFVRKRKKVDNFIYARGKKFDNCLYAREKKVDFAENHRHPRDALCPKNVNFQFKSDIVDLIFYAHNVANLGFWRIEPKIAF